MTGNSAKGSEKTKLDRVRHRQRQSRARKKERMEFLEDFKQRSERAGIKASQEVQVAAQRVLTEIKRLEAFIEARGISKAELDSFVIGEDLPGDPTAVADLQHAMQPRKIPKSEQPTAALEQCLETAMPIQEKPGLDYSLPTPSSGASTTPGSITTATFLSMLSNDGYECCGRCSQPYRNPLGFFAVYQRYLEVGGLCHQSQYDECCGLCGQPLQGPLAIAYAAYQRYLECFPPSHTRADGYRLWAAWNVA